MQRDIGFLHLTHDRVLFIFSYQVPPPEFGLPENEVRGRSVSDSLEVYTNQVLAEEPRLLEPAGHDPQSALASRAKTIVQLSFRV